MRGEQKVLGSLWGRGPKGARLIFASPFPTTPIKCRTPFYVGTNFAASLIVKRRFYLVTLSTFLFAACGGITPREKLSPQASQPSNAVEQARFDEGHWLKIIVLDVGQGDAALLIAPTGEAALIDTGPPQTGAEAILKTMKELGLTQIQTIFISHHHEDHTGGLPLLLQTEWGKQAVVIDKTNAVVGRTLPFGEATVAMVAGNGEFGQTSLAPAAREDENNLSLALLIEYGTFRYFTDGDLPGGGGDPPYQTLDLESLVAPLVGDVDVILVPHHGSHTSTSENFLKTLRPEAAILSVGRENDFFHPHLVVLRRLEEAKVRLWPTDREGSICIVTDGHEYAVKPYGIDKCAPPL